MLKAECLQRTGSFKIRGASHAMRRLSRAELARRCAASAGNHAQAVALAADRRGAAPSSSCRSRAARQGRGGRGYGGEVRLVEGGYDEAAEAAARARASARAWRSSTPSTTARSSRPGHRGPRDRRGGARDAADRGRRSGAAASPPGSRSPSSRGSRGVRVVGVQAEACAPYLASLAAHRPIGAARRARSATASPSSGPAS